MITKPSILIITLIAVLFASCGREREIECDNPQIKTAFIAYASSDIDTFIIRKFKVADNYQTLLDTFRVTYGWSGVYAASNDTTTVSINDGKHGIIAGFDWQVFIPATNKTVFISDIVSDKKTGKCRYGIFSMDKQGCYCLNRVYSAKMNNQVINFPDSSSAYTVYIRN